MLSRTSTLGVLGSGQMGTGIGIVAARHAEQRVMFVDPVEGSLKKSQSFIEGWCAKQIKQERMTAEEAELMRSRISWHSEIPAVQDANFIVEAVNEDFGLKKRIFQTLDKEVQPDCILATNT